MNEKLLEYLPDPETVKGGLGAVLETLQTEAPVLVKEILWYKGVTSFICFLFTLAVPTTIWLVLRYYKEALIAYDKQKPDCNWPAVNVLTWLVTISFSSIAIFGYNGWLQILIAPRLFLLEYLDKLM